MSFKSLNHKNFGVIVYLLSLLANVLLYLIIFSKITQNGIEYYFNSDALYFPTLYKDLVRDGYSLRGWYVPGAPNFLPDMLLYFIIMSFCNNPVCASFTYGIVQFLIFLLLINWLTNLVSGQKNYFLNSLINLSLSIFFFVYIFSNDFFLPFHIISNTYHLGSFLMALLSLALTLKFLQTERKLFLYLILIVASLAIFNDKLYIIVYTLPLLSLVIFLRGNKKNLIKRLLIVNLISIIVGLALFRIMIILKLVHVYNIKQLIDFSRINYSFKLFFEQIISYYYSYSFQTLIIVISIITLLMSLIFVLINFKKYFFTRDVDLKNTDTLKFFYVLFFTISSILIIFAPLVTGLYLDHSCIRYNIFSLYILTFNFFPLIYFFSSSYYKQKVNFLNNLFSIISTVLIVAYIIIFINKFDRQGFNAYLNYYPKCAECIDKYIEKNKSVYGITTYWIGKVALNFSKQGARTYTVYDDSFYPYPHAGNIDWYIDNKGKYNNPVFTYIVIDNPQQLEVIVKNYKEPLKIDTCDKYLILTYNPFKFDNEYKPYFLVFIKKTVLLDFESVTDEYKKLFTISDKFSYSGKYSNYIGKENEYSYASIVNYKEIDTLNCSKVNLKVMLLFEKKCDLNVVLSIEDGLTNILWKNIQINENHYQLNKWQEFILSADLPANLPESAIIKAYVWNPNKGEAFIDDIKLEFY